MMEFELVIDGNVELAETPIWDQRTGRLYWTDLFSGDIHGYNPQTKQEKVWQTGKLIGSALPCSDPAKLLCVLEDGAYLLDLETGEMDFITDPEKGNEHNRYNDSRADAAGRLFMSSVSKLYGTGDYHPDMLGGFYMLDTDHKTVKTIVEGINQYNAIVWNKADTKMYVVDTFNQKLVSFDYDIAKGPIGGPVDVIDFAKYGMPDGMSIDEEDNLYVCHWTGKITVWDKELKFVKEIPFPVEYACCGGFGGEEMQDFYVASSKYCYTPEQLAQNKGAGGIFAARSPIKGRPDNFFIVNKN